ncbi:MAG: hypothetical protein QOG05_1259 [Streptosporangiaceae bacterium]|nr:hypothetical protein [Streptosporangiaceae bacterium]
MQPAAEAAGGAAPQAGRRYGSPRRGLAVRTSAGRWLGWGVHSAFKVSPPDTTWDAMLQVWRAADDIEVFESGWTSDHFHPMHGATPSTSRLRAGSRSPRSRRRPAGVHRRPRRAAHAPHRGPPAALGAAGAGLTIVSWPAPHRPAVLEPLASALSELP